MAPLTNDDDGTVRRHISDLLDRVLVRAESGYGVQDELRKMASEAQSASLSDILARAQGAVGLVNSSTQGRPDREVAFAAVTALKQELRSAR